jgi:hypothetical protein
VTEVTLLLYRVGEQKNLIRNFWLLLSSLLFPSFESWFFVFNSEQYGGIFAASLTNLKDGRKNDF